MAKFTVYGSNECPGCQALKKELEEKNITEFEFKNITGSLPALKEFLKIRDTAPEYDAIRARNGVGIPLIVTPSGKRSFELPKNLEELYK